MASGKRTDLFIALQRVENTGKAEGKAWKLVVDGGIRWNSSYSMIQRGIELRQALDQYSYRLKLSKDLYDVEVAQQDYLTADEWAELEVIKTQLEPLFRLTKDLEGNAKL